MTRQSGLLAALGCWMLSGGVAGALAADAVGPSGEEILTRVGAEIARHHTLLKEYTVSRQYTMENFRFGKLASVGMLMSYRLVEGERYTVLTRSGSERLNSIIDQVVASEANASAPEENARRQISPANYRVRLLRSEMAAGRSCYVLDLMPRFKNRFLIVGKVWVDVESYGVVRIEGQFAASMSMLVGTPHISEEFAAVNCFWLPEHVRSITSSFLLGPTELNIVFSDYRFDRDSASH